MRAAPPLLAALLAAAAPLAAEDAPACAPGRVVIDAASGPRAFAVEIADDAAERARGLMFRLDLAPEEGMLFLFPDAAERAFWMKNTPLSLDMLFIDPAGRVCGIVEQADPYTLAPRRSGCAASAVLEINGGLVEALGIGVGDPVRHPAFGPEAAWPCPPA